MNPILKRAKDRIELIKPNGERFPCDKTIVQSKMIFIYCGKIPIEENDEIIHKIDENHTQEFIVEDRCYHNDRLFGEHYQAKVKRKIKTPTSSRTIKKIKMKLLKDHFLHMMATNLMFSSVMLIKIQKLFLKKFLGFKMTDIISGMTTG